MKKRSEILKKRSEVASPKAEPEAARAGSVRCGGCDELVEVARIKTFRENKSGECPECGAEITSGAMNDADPVVADEEGDARTASEMAAKHGPLNPERKWCGKCGSEWPIVDGQFVINCGHTHAARVDDPRKAERLAPPAGLSVRPRKEAEKRDAAEEKAASKPDFAETMRAANEHAKQHGSGKKDSRDTSGFNATAPAPKITIEGNRLSVEWGKSTFPLGMMMNFTVGGFFASIEHEPGKRLEAFREIMSDFAEMADEAFAKQSAWYQEKLGTLK